MDLARSQLHLLKPWCNGLFMDFWATAQLSETNELKIKIAIEKEDEFRFNVAN